MRKRKTRNKTQNQETASNSQSDDLRAFIAEADQVEQMSSSLGWAIIERDFNNLRKQRADEIPYLNKNLKEFDDAVLEFRAIDRLFKLIDDYKHNRKEALEQLKKLENPETNIILDVDN